MLTSRPRATPTSNPRIGSHIDSASLASAGGFPPPTRWLLAHPRGRPPGSRRRAGALAAILPPHGGDPATGASPRGPAAARSAWGSPIAAIRYGGASRRVLHRIVVPTQERPLCPTSRSSLTAIASAPAAHSVPTTACTSE